MLHAAEHTYTFGISPEQDKSRTLSAWQPVIEEISKEASVPLRIQTEGNLDAYGAKIRAGAYDFALIDPVEIKNSADTYTPVARQDGKLQAILVVPKKSPILTTNDLIHKQVAFSTKDSLAARLVTRDIVDTGFKMGSDVRVSYLGTEDSVYGAVSTGAADAGAATMRTFLLLPPETAEKLRILSSAVPTSPPPIVAAKRLPEHVSQSVQHAILQLGTTPQGFRLLRAVGMGRLIEAHADDWKDVN